MIDLEVGNEDSEIKMTLHFPQNYKSFICYVMVGV